jgi:hypothetical protein
MLPQGRYNIYCVLTAIFCLIIHPTQRGDKFKYGPVFLVISKKYVLAQSSKAVLKEQLPLLSQFC